ncbi:MFS transporter [Terriglobus saanensis]|uniref:Major facilitator superfamily MFS_1 n=1 Tax=Terriglobus saanensis (strain ATCC BAA-1853 / DSM 23119 / SP1PR4) TaxID=401053 RepID=E8V2N1_TERSS|nr:MFS transporter [Terriglobus saanensis]ADV83506.1 major facilitator superfamily MFS_1 [Terriglobus saanensis SP1PR4]
MTKPASAGIFYGWWIVGAAFLNLFCAVGIIYYGFPVFYPAFVTSLGFTRAEVTQGFLLGFLVIGLPFGLLAGVLIDRIGTRWVILSGVGLVGLPLIGMGFMNHFWQYQLLCIFEVIGYTLAGPIANQVLVAHWFHTQRGRAMGYAYLGLGLGGAVSPPTMNWLLHHFGWRHALEMVGATILLVLFPTGFWVTHSKPADLGLYPDGALVPVPREVHTAADLSTLGAMKVAFKDKNFWLLVAGSALVIGALNAVIQHFIFFLISRGYTSASASRYLSMLLIASLGGRVVVGYIADRFKRKNTMAGFYFLLGAAIPLLYLAHQPLIAATFALLFGFSMGADYMLIPLVTAECFGVASLGKILALVIMGYSIGQWIGPWVAGRIFDAHHSYDPAWKVMSIAALLGSVAIYSISKKPVVIAE